MWLWGEVWGWELKCREIDTCSNYSLISRVCIWLPSSDHVFFLKTERICTFFVQVGFPFGHFGLVSGRPCTRLYCVVRVKRHVVKLWFQQMDHKCSIHIASAWWFGRMMYNLFLYFENNTRLLANRIECSPWSRCNPALTWINLH